MTTIDTSPSSSHQHQADDHAPIVIALGGNALLKRGEQMTMDNQRQSIAEGMQALAPVILGNDINNDNSKQQKKQRPAVIVHGNGPQVGLLMLESTAYEKSTGLPQISLDVLDAETEGMIGYLIEQELHRHLQQSNNENRGMVTVLSQIVCDPSDPAFCNPTKFVGPVYTKEESEKLNVTVKQDGGYYRRVVPSPRPIKMVDSQLQAIKTLVDNDSIVICAGGGGIPVVEDAEQKGHYRGIEAVIDKDRAAAMVGFELGASGLLILTDVSAVSVNFGTPNERRIKRASPSALRELLKQGQFPAGSMGPKIESAIDFVTSDSNNDEDGTQTKKWAAIGSLKEADKIMDGTAGTIIAMAAGSGCGSDKDDGYLLEFYD